MNDVDTCQVSVEYANMCAHATTTHRVNVYTSLDSTQLTLNWNQSRVNYNELINKCTGLCKTVQYSQYKSKMVLNTVAEWNKRIQLKQNISISFVDVPTLNVPTVLLF